MKLIMNIKRTNTSAPTEHISCPFHPDSLVMKHKTNILQIRGIPDIHLRAKVVRVTSQEVMKAKVPPLFKFALLDELGEIANNIGDEYAFKVMEKNSNLKTVIIPPELDELVVFKPHFCPLHPESALSKNEGQIQRISEIPDLQVRANLIKKEAYTILNESELSQASKILLLNELDAIARRIREEYVSKAFEKNPKLKTVIVPGELVKILDDTRKSLSTIKDEVESNFDYGIQKHGKAKSRKFREFESEIIEEPIDTLLGEFGKIDLFVEGDEPQASADMWGPLKDLKF